MLFNMAALYRTAIYSEIDRHFDCEWYFSDLKSDIKWMDLSVLKSVTKLKVIFFHSLSWQKGSIKLLKKDADIIFAIGDPFSISLWTILILKKITFNKRKIFLWTHGWYGDESIGKTFIKKLFFSLSDGVFLYGNYAKRIMAKKGCNINNVWVIHNSLDYIRQLELRNSIHKTNVYEKRFGNNLYNIVFIGRLTESKRLDMIIKALDILRKKNIECNLTIIGNGNGMEKPKHLATELEINLWLYGACYDENINAIQRQYNVVVLSRGTDVKISGSEENVERAVQAISALMKISGTGERVTDQTIRYVTSMVSEGETEQLNNLLGDGICVTATGKIIRPRTVGQKKYVDSIRNNTIVLGVGPAGTGKTYLAVAMAAKAFKAHEINKIILTRPAVEAGEKLGFLPGDLQDKVDPYLRPLYDALFDMFGADSFNKYMEKGIIEVAPLAYMRGRTLEGAFIILDEAQNTTSEQIKMFLTRLGNDSKMVINGDITQIDLPDSKKSGLIEAMKVLRNVDDICIHKFNEKDVVRHKLVQDIVKAYEKYSSERKK